MPIALPLRYPKLYPWYLLLAALDVVVTWMLLGLGGREANVIAEQIITGGGLPAAVALKAASVLTVLLICEVVGRRHDRMGRRLAAAAVVLSVLPVAVGAIALAEFAAVYVVYA